MPGAAAAGGARDGFAVTAEAYRHQVDECGAGPALRAALDGLRPADVADLAARARRAREIVAGIPITGDLREQVVMAYRRLMAECGPATTLAVRSSATAEDLPTASFAGQHETYLNHSGICGQAPSDYPEIAEFLVRLASTRSA